MKIMYFFNTLLLNCRSVFFLEEFKMAQIKLKTGDNKYEYIEDRRLHIGNSQPTNSETNDLWLDTDEAGVALQPELPKFSGIVKQTLDNNEVPTFSAAVANEDF